MLQVLGAARDIEREIVEVRRKVHMYPEIGLETPRTSALVAGILRELGVEVRERVGGHGVVGLLRGERGAGKTVALRADMDALPVTEETGKEYSSKVPGAMHACGHDAHVAILLGAAKILAGMRSGFGGSVKLLFQPGEEGSGGARLMIEDGCLEDPRPDAVFGLHVGPLWGLATGGVGVRSGPLMASSDGFSLVVRGKGGHGAMPHASVDPVVIASHIVVALQTVVSREVSPDNPAVITVGKIEAGTAKNIIPEACTMQGTVRYLDRNLRTLLPSRIRAIATGVARAMRGRVELEYTYGYPSLVNDPGATAFAAESAASVVGERKVKDIRPTMGSEDMAYYLQEVPGCYLSLGTAGPDESTRFPNHHPKFDVDESALPVGSAVLARICLDFLADPGRLARSSGWSGAQRKGGSRR